MRSILFPAPNTKWEYEELEPNLIWVPVPKYGYTMQDLKKFYVDPAAPNRARISLQSKNHINRNTKKPRSYFRRKKKNGSFL